MISLALLLTGCTTVSTGREEALATQFREDYTAMTSCTATLQVTADYGQRVYEYEMTVAYEKKGETVLTITAPENIAGVTARIQDGETALVFDGVYLETGALSDTGLSPIDAIPALLAYAQGGYIAQCAIETLDDKQALHLCYRAPEAKDGVGEEAQLWMDTGTGALLRGELSMDGFTVIQCSFTGFSMELPAQQAPAT